MKEKQEKIVKLKQRQQALTTDPAVAEYLKITAEIDSIDYMALSNENILKKAIYQTNIKHTNEIYVCVAAYKDVPDYLKQILGTRYGTDLNDPEAKYKCYVDIEKSFSDGQKLIPIDQCEGFEKNHNVLYSKDMEPMKFYNYVRNKFFETCINESQEKAAEKLTIIKILSQ